MGEKEELQNIVKKEKGTKKLIKAYKNLENKIKKQQSESSTTKEEREKGAEIAGKIMENTTGIPGIKKGINALEKDLTKRGYWEKQRKKAEENKKKK